MFCVQFVWIFSLQTECRVARSTLCSPGANSTTRPCKVFTPRSKSLNFLAPKLQIMYLQIIPDVAFVVHIQLVILRWCIIGWCKDKCNFVWLHISLWQTLNTSCIVRRCDQDLTCKVMAAVGFPLFTSLMNFLNSCLKNIFWICQIFSPSWADCSSTCTLSLF